jgi:hypothetical protein
MGRWQALIDELIANLAAEPPDEELRINIDHKLREAETRASNLSAPATLAEKSVHRKREFQASLRLSLGALRVRDPSNKIWIEALQLLGNRSFADSLKAIGHSSTYRKGPCGPRP